MEEGKILKNFKGMLFEKMMRQFTIKFMDEATSLFFILVKKPPVDFFHRIPGSTPVAWKQRVQPC
jgi:hypothetical protein